VLNVTLARLLTAALAEVAVQLANDASALR
jgi:hypothetical protein